MVGESRNEKYRYPVDEQLSDITPMASIEAYLGNAPVRVLNVSLGGLALILDKNPEFQVGDPLDISVSVRGRAFPMQLEVKQVNGLRVSCAYLNMPPSFLPALREFLGPKFLGASLQFQKSHQDLAAAIELVSGAEFYEAHTGTNQTGVFLWMGPQRELLKLLAVTRELVLGWDPISGARSGRLSAASGLDDVSWDRIPEVTVLHYLADILFAWRPQSLDRGWLENLFDVAPNSDDAKKIKVPYSFSANV
ncbi:MAG: PilZ domain-containing protein [Bdellovibrionota bacterium]